MAMDWPAGRGVGWWCDRTGCQQRQQPLMRAGQAVAAMRKLLMLGVLLADARATTESVSAIGIAQTGRGLSTQSDLKLPLMPPLTPPRAPPRAPPFAPPLAPPKPPTVPPSYPPSSPPQLLKKVAKLLLLKAAIKRLRHAVLEDPPYPPALPPAPPRPPPYPCSVCDAGQGCGVCLVKLFDDTCPPLNEMRAMPSCSSVAPDEACYGLEGECGTSVVPSCNIYPAYFRIDCVLRPFPPPSPSPFPLPPPPLLPPAPPLPPPPFVPKLALSPSAPPLPSPPPKIALQPPSPLRPPPPPKIALSPTPPASPSSPVSTKVAFSPPPAAP